MTMAHRVVLLSLLATLTLSACGGEEDGESADGAPDSSTSTPSPTPGDQSALASNGTAIRISFGDTELTARLHDNATARDLAAQLPVTLTFRDHNNAEKTAPLPASSLSTTRPQDTIPAAGDIGYWAPDSDFVLYYDNDAPYFDGIVRIGEFDGDMQAITRLADDSSVTIGHAE